MNVAFLVPDFPVTQRHHTRALRDQGCRVLGIGEKPWDQLDPEIKSWMADFEHVPNTRDEQAVIEAACRLNARSRLDRLECTLEMQMLPAARAREALGLPGPSSESILICRDKFLMKQHLRARGIPCARVAEATSADAVRTFAAEVGFPLILKPRDLAGSHGTQRINDAAQLDEALKVFVAGPPEHPLAAEEFVTGSEGMYDTLVLNGEVVFEVISHYIPNVLEAKRTRAISPITIVTNRMDAPGYEPLKKFGRQVIRELGLQTTPTHMEWFLGDKGLYFGEIGARPPGDRFWDVYNWANDFSLFDEWARAIVHGRCSPRPSRRYAVGMVSVRPDRDGTIKGYTGVDECRRRCGGCIIELGLPPVGQKAPGVGDADISQAYAFIKHENYDECLAMLQFVGRTLKMHAG